jgi:hypothetical protein
MENINKTDEQLNHIIAKWIGWKYIEGKSVFVKRFWAYETINPYWELGETKTEELPDFCRDLNLMHTAENKLTDGEYDTFEQNLARS